MNTPHAATARKFRPHVRQLVNEEVIPLVHKAEETQVFPVSVWRRLGEEGLLGLGLAKEHGGLGGGRTSEVMVVEELSRAAAGIAMSIMPAYIVRVALWTFGAGKLIEEVGESLIRGERIVGIAITEPNAGSDVSSIQTRVERTDGGYLLNGSKIFITNGNLADDLLVVARTGGNTRHPRDGPVLCFHEPGWVQVPEAGQGIRPILGHRGSMVQRLLRPRPPCGW